MNISTCTRNRLICIEEKALEKQRKAAPKVAHKQYTEANKLVTDKTATLSDISPLPAVCMLQERLAVEEDRELQVVAKHVHHRPVSDGPYSIGVTQCLREASQDVVALKLALSESYRIFIVVGDKEVFLTRGPAGVRISFDSWCIRMNVSHEAYIVRPTGPDGPAYVLIESVVYCESSMNSYSLAFHN